MRISNANAYLANSLQPFFDQALMPVMTQPDPFFLGYQGMKVASMTIERAILDRRPGAAVERHHWLTAATLRAFRQTRDWMSGVGPVYDSFRHQVVMAEGVPDKLADRERIIARRSWSLRFTG